MDTPPDEQSGAGGVPTSPTPPTQTTRATSTQNTQYDQIGADYLKIKILPAAQSEVPSILNALGRDGVRGQRCLDLACGTGKYTHLLSTLGATSVTGLDISPTMITAAQTAYPAPAFPSLHFEVSDCSVPGSLPSDNGGGYDLVFSAWFLNYAGTARELTGMFCVIAEQMSEGGRFVGLTTDVHDEAMHVPKMGFYGLDVLVLEPVYRDPESGEVLGIKARVVVGGEEGFGFNVFQFTKEVYEKAAKEAGLAIVWRDVVVPDDERRGTGYWNEYLRRPTFAMLEARKVV